MNEIGAVIVTYNSERFVGRCLRSLEGVEAIVVVDNASADRTTQVVTEAAPNAQLLRNDSNRGFAAAVNQGVRALDAKVIVLVNPDIELQAPMTPSNPLIRRALENDAGVVGAKLVGEDGEFQTGFAVRAFPTPAALALEALLVHRLWPGNAVNRRYRQLDLDPDKPQPCDQPAGALLAFRREIHEQVGGFDERFFPLWFEDVDFCLAASQAGYRNYYEPRCIARHYGAHSVAAMSVRRRQAAWYGSLLRFAEKRFSPTAVGWLRPAVALSLAARGLGCFLGAGKRDEGRAYFRAIRAVLSDAGRLAPSSGARLESGPVA